jgi:excisionase family DNA binding protein
MAEAALPNVEEHPVTHDQLEEHRHLLTVEETAEYLGLARRDTYALVLSGGIESVGIGSRRLIASGAISSHLRHLGEASLAKLLLRVLHAGVLPTVLEGGHAYVSVGALLELLEFPTEVRS